LNLGKCYKQPQPANNNNKRDTGENYTDPGEMFAGYPILFESTKSCTAAFIGNKQGIDGLITSAQCCTRINCNFFPNQHPDSVSENLDDGNITHIGYAYDMMFGDNGLDYVFVNSISIDWNNIPYTTGLTSDDSTISELYPITSYLTLNETGQE
ncbi:11116_t:CDS:1, partial [Racocetra persica]